MDNNNNNGFDQQGNNGNVKDDGFNSQPQNGPFNNPNVAPPQNGSFNNPNVTPPQSGTFSNPNVTPQQNYQYANNQQPNYNQPYSQYPNYGGPVGPIGPEDPGKGLAIAGMVCGIAGLVLTWFFGIGLVPSIVGIVLSIMSGNKSSAVGLKRSGMATAGLVCSAISLGLSALVLISCIACVGCTSCSACGAATSIPSYYY